MLSTLDADVEGYLAVCLCGSDTSFESMVDDGLLDEACNAAGQNTLETCTNWLETVAVDHMFDGYMI